MIQLTLTLKITTAQVVEMSVTVNKNSLIQDYGHPHDHTQLAHKMTPGFKPFTALLEVMEKLSVSSLRMLCSHEVHKLLQQGTGTKLVRVFTHYRYLVCHCVHHWSI